MSVPLTAVRRVEVHKFNAWGTIGLIVGGFAVALSVAAAACAESDCLDWEQ